MAPISKDRTVSLMGRRIESALTSLNDQFSFLLFLEHEFLERIQDFGPALSNNFTTDVFARNPNASRIHIQLHKLPMFIQANRAASFSAYFTASYEVTVPIFGWVLAVLQRTNSPPIQLPKRRRESPEQYYARALVVLGCATPPVELLHTMSWIRYRRNGLVHVNDKISPMFKALAANTGMILNSFWARAKVRLDFSNASTGPLDQQETVDLLKILRILVRRFDSHFVSLIHPRGLAYAEAERLFADEQIRMNQVVAANRSERLRAEIFRKFGLSLPEKDLIDAAKAFGKK